MNRPATDPQTLLQRVLQSPGFRQSPPHQGLLQYICGHTQAGDLEVLHEHDIGVQLFGMPPGYDVNAAPVVRQIADETRDLLAEYFRTQGRRESLRLAIPKGEYRAFFYQAPPEEMEPEQLDAIGQFWAAYLQSGARNYLVHGELEGEQLSISEAYALVKIAALFEKHTAALEIRALQSFELRDLQGVNVILLGTPENNSLLKAALDDPPVQPLVKRMAATDYQGAVTIVTAPDAAGVLQAAFFATTEEPLAGTRDKTLASGFPSDFDLKVK
ncbi:MAG: hypothetical protein JNL98_28135 [Bryobacterales bacterium]|nr:hypothetical protein [Bryobacterales bacterium]